MSVNQKPCYIDDEAQQRASLCVNKRLVNYSGPSNLTASYRVTRQDSVFILEASLCVTLT